MSKGAGPGVSLGWRQNVAAIVMDDEGNVLLGRKNAKNRFLHFPQGGVKKKESLDEAVFREIKEEVGLDKEQCGILSRLGGLRYRYRRKNKKSAKWQGQEQTFFLIRCAGITPKTVPGKEFETVCWLPYQQLDPSLFISFKREVVAKALSFFFPAHIRDIGAYHASLSIMSAYRYRKGLGSCDPDGHAFWGGGKEEAQAQMAELARQMTRTQKQLGETLRVSVIILGLPGSGRNHCLRHIARCLDPLATSLIPSTEGKKEEYASGLVSLVPAPGIMQIAAHTPYDILLQGIMEGEDQAWQRRAAHLSDMEGMLREEGYTVLKFYLHVSAQEAGRHQKSGFAPAMWEQSIRAVDALLSSTSRSFPWYIIPSDRRWYRDLLICSIIAQEWARKATDDPGGERI